MVRRLIQHGSHRSSLNFVAAGEGQHTESASLATFWHHETKLKRNERRVTGVAVMTFGLPNTSLASTSRLPCRAVERPSGSFQCSLHT